MSSRSKQRAEGRRAPESSTGLSDFERVLLESAGPQRACLKLAHTLGVSHNEIALLRLEKGSLRFIYPGELRGAGMIPLSSPAVAARTAATRTSLLSNSFTRVRHVSLFESVKLASAEDGGDSEQMPIQKIMSVPVIQPAGNVVGVVQVSRKGLDLSLAGADFTGEDLRQLERASELLANMPFMQEGAPLDETPASLIPGQQDVQ